PVFYLAGGPGVGAITEAPYLATTFGPLLAKRDLVLVDQRGTGGSNPLDCDLGVGLLPKPVPAASVLACRRELEKKADLRLYTTGLAMDDLDEVRAALGYAAIDLLGDSYGTLAAQDYLRRHGEHVRAAILEGVVPPDPAAYLAYAEDAERALAAVLAACAADKSCHAAFPDPREELAAVLRGLARRPAGVEVVEEGRRVGKIVFTRDLFAATLRGRLYSARAAVRIPRALHQAIRGDYADMAHAAWTMEHAGGQGLSEGLLLAVSCSESLAFLDPAEVVRRSARTFLGPWPVLHRLDACRGWPRAAVPTDFTKPLVSAVPALLLSGEWDPVTPPSGGERVSRGFANGLHLTVRAAGHSFDDPCTAGILAAFLDAATVRGLDTSCLARRPPPVFPIDP
ncbi:MAG TPA: alpha/beta fold hydrolase, partial [Thermoanaerobaculia bacterium]|nr:alpha/beta fold hydrolase [Thermoanaerobaculia bacterium]